MNGATHRRIGILVHDGCDLAMARQLEHPVDPAGRDAIPATVERSAP